VYSDQLLISHTIALRPRELNGFMKLIIFICEFAKKKIVKIMARKNWLDSGKINIILVQFINHVDISQHYSKSTSQILQHLR
jgi:hypothetical protein